MKRTTTSAPSVEDLAARISVLEAELARVKALAEGAQRATFRASRRLEMAFIQVHRATDVSCDPYDFEGGLDEAIADEEGDRAARIDDGEAEA